MRDHRYNTLTYYAMRRDLFIRIGWTQERAMAETQKLRDRLEIMFLPRIIATNGLDNPLMCEDARLCIINQINRNCRRVE